MPVSEFSQSTMLSPRIPQQCVEKFKDPILTESEVTDALSSMENVSSKRKCSVILSSRVMSGLISKLKRLSVSTCHSA